MEFRALSLAGVGGFLFSHAHLLPCLFSAHAPCLLLVFLFSVLYIAIISTLDALQGSMSETGK